MEGEKEEERRIIQEKRKGKEKEGKDQAVKERIGSGRIGRESIGIESQEEEGKGMVTKRKEEKE